jgi:hypothetical protein
MKASLALEIGFRVDKRTLPKSLSSLNLFVRAREGVKNFCKINTVRFKFRHSSASFGQAR